MMWEIFINFGRHHILGGFPFFYPIAADSIGYWRMMFTVMMIGAITVSYISVAPVLRGIAGGAFFSLVMSYECASTQVGDWVWTLFLFSFISTIVSWIMVDGYKSIITARNIRLHRLSIEEEREHQNKRTIQDRRRGQDGEENVTTVWDGIDRRTKPTEPQVHYSKKKI